MTTCMINIHLYDSQCRLALNEEKPNMRVVANVGVRKLTPTYGVDARIASRLAVSVANPNKCLTHA